MGSPVGWQKGPPLPPGPGSLKLQRKRWQEDVAKHCCPRHVGRQMGTSLPPYLKSQGLPVGPGTLSKGLRLAAGTRVQDKGAYVVPQMPLCLC